MNTSQPLFQNFIGKINFNHCHNYFRVELKDMLIEMNKVELIDFKQYIFNILKFIPKFRKSKNERIMIKPKCSNVFLLFNPNEIKGIFNLIVGSEINFEAQHGYQISKQLKSNFELLSKSLK